MKSVKCNNKLGIFLYALLISMGMNAANTTTTKNSLSSGTNVAANVDYVLTSTTPFTSSSAYINIPSASMEHSVVIFKAIKPSTVIKNWLSYVRINGATAVNGTNCQVRMYNKGAIVLPYNSSTAFLTCYSGTNYTGTSCTSYTTGSNGGYMRTLTDVQLKNNFKSFKLKRGYMVTFATGTSGWGYSRCFVAATEDLEMNLPAVLAGKVSSYRLFQWYNFGKSGIANNTDATVCDALNVQGCYTYNVGQNRLPDVEWLPHKVQRWWPGVAECAQTEYACTMKTDNEPANSGDDEPASVEEVLGYWEDAMRTGMRLCSPSSWDGNMNWQKDFFAAIDARGWRCDLYDLHCYWTNFNNLQTYYDNYGRPLLISEWMWGASWSGGSGSFTSGVTDATIKTNVSNILTTLNNAAYVERYFYWNNESKAKIYDGGLTDLGKTYAATDGGLGYNAAKEYIPVVVIHRPYSFSGTASGNFISLSWKDKNGDMMDEIRVQYKTASATSWTTLATVERKDKTDSGDQNYTFNGTLDKAESFNWRVVDMFDGKEYSSDALMGTTELVNNTNVLPVNLTDFYFQFYSKEASTNLVWAVYNSNNSENRVYYKAANSNYASDLYQLWTLETNSNGGFSLRNVGEPDYLIASPYSWNFVTRNDDYKVEAAKTAFDFIYYSSGDYWICKNLAHNMYVGLWDNDKNFSVGEVLAGNRTNPTGNDSGDKLGIRLIPRSMVNDALGIVTIPSGNYYLYNNESGLFIAGGNKWDTQAIVAETGLDFTIAMQSNGYTLDSNVSNGGDSHYLGSNFYVDGNPFEWTFAKAGTINGKQAYTITNGTDYLSSPTTVNTALTTTTNANAASAKWLLLTRNDLMKMLEDASQSNPVNATFLLPDARFGRNDARIENWNGNPTCNGHADADWGNFNGEKFNTTFDVYQLITDAPNGIYEISMQGYYRCGGYNDAATKRAASTEELNALLYGNDQTQPLPSIFEDAGSSKKEKNDVSTTYGYIPNGQAGASHYIHDGLYKIGPLRFTVENGSLRVGVKKTVAVANDWTLFDDFRLMYLGPSVKSGDVNNDNAITIADITALVNIILGKDNALPHQYNHLAADVNQDGAITISDVTALVNIILGKF